MKDLLIIIPAYNEEKNIKSVLFDFNKIKSIADVIVINDGSKDLTYDYIKQMGHECINLPFNAGYGNALKTGFKYADSQNYKYLITFDGDGQHSIDDLLKVYDELLKEEADMVIGSRFLLNGLKDMMFSKKIAISILKFSFFIFTSKKIHDPTSGLKGLNKKVYSFYAHSDFYSSDYPDTDILINTVWNGFKFSEIPISSNERLYGESMHSGIRPIYYFIKFALNTIILLISKLMMRENKK